MPTIHRIPQTDSRWLLPSGASVIGQDLFTLSQPLLRRQCLSRDFEFFDATLLLACSGRLALEDRREVVGSEDATSVIVVPAQTRLTVAKFPGEPEGLFRSVFLTFSRRIIDTFHQIHMSSAYATASPVGARKVALDASFADTLSYCLRGLATEGISERECEHRLIGVLIALADRGWQFTRPGLPSVADRLRDILRSDPASPWTAAAASARLAMSEATLRRRLVKEQLGFEEILVSIRMHHAMTLLQTTRWSIPQIALASGYQSRTRFTARFRERFGCSPSEAR